MKFQVMVTALSLVGLFFAGLPQARGQDYSAPYQQSVELEAQGQYALALEALMKVPPARQGEYMVQLRLGWLNYLNARYDRAVDGYTRALGLKPKATEARLGLMLSQMGARRWLDAEKTGKEILKTEPLSYLANSRLAFTYYSLTRFPEAEVAYKRVLELYPSDVEMRSGYGWSLLKQGKYEDARREFKTILEVAPKHAAALEGMRLCP
jgi:tetratricopeptide (TPR) repeat protein